MSYAPYTTWSNDMVFDLVDMVRERPILWDNTLDEHIRKDRVKKHAAWLEVAEHFGMEKDVVEKKMRMLTGQYRREAARVLAGAGRSRWFAFQRLAYLGGMEGSGGGSGSKTQTANELVEDRSRSMPLYDEEECSEDSLSMQKNIPFPAPIEYPVKRPRLESKNPLMDIASSDAVLSMLCEERSSRDEFVVYGEYVAHKLRNIPSQRARNTAQFHINNILYNAETGQYDEPKPSSSRTVPGSRQKDRPLAEGAQKEGKRAAAGLRWEDESVTSLTESMHSGEDGPMIECIQIKLED